MQVGFNEMGFVEFGVMWGFWCIFFTSFGPRLSFIGVMGDGRMGARFRFGEIVVWKCWFRCCDGFWFVGEG